MKKYILIMILFLAGNIYAFSKNQVVVLTVNGGIGPATVNYIKNGIDEAVESKSKAIVIKLNTPGGLLESTREIASYMLDCEIPVIVYVSPGGSRAGSAGVFITLAGHVAAMAPGTNIGAAHPVGLDGSSEKTVMEHKIENDAAAFVRSIAQKRGKNALWAEKAVRESISSTENEALESGVIDFIAKDLNNLLVKCKSKKIVLSNDSVSLNFDGSSILIRDMTWQETLLDVISDPNIAYLFILIGIYGIFFELKSPGAIFPGAVGSLALLLAAYSLQMLPVNYIGLGLMILAFVLFILEIFVISYGMLSIGGIIAFTIGSVMLIDSPHEFMRISMSLIIITSLLTALLIAVILYFGIKAQKTKNVSGKFTIIDSKGIAKTHISPLKKGKVLVQGEIWQAESDEEIQQNENVIVTEVKAMLIKVKKIL